MGLICSFLILKRINDNPVMTDAFNARTTLNLTFLISIIFYSRLISRLISSILVQVLVFLSQRGWACISGVSLLQQKWKRFFSSDSLLSGWIAQQWQCSYIILSQAHRGKDLRLSHLDPGASLLSVCLSSQALDEDDELCIAAALRESWSPAPVGSETHPEVLYEITQTPCIR